jgi:hypothetical protein
MYCNKHPSIAKSASTENVNNPPTTSFAVYADSVTTSESGASFRNFVRVLIAILSVRGITPS